MPTYDAQSADCYVFTFKEGLLSAVAHDLKLRVTSFRLEIDPSGPAVQATFDPTSLRVVCTMRHGAEVPGTPSDSDKREIERNIVREVLEAERFPEIRFASSSVTPEGNGHRVRGTLHLHGRSGELEFLAGAEGEDRVAEVRLHQPDFGIRPYRAMMGTLRVQADVIVRVRLPSYTPKG
jgi:hypothetical protein